MIAQLRANPGRRTVLETGGFGVLRGGALVFLSLCVLGCSSLGREPVVGADADAEVDASPQKPSEVADASSSRDGEPVTDASSGFSLEPPAADIATPTAVAGESCEAEAARSCSLQGPLLCEDGQWLSLPLCPEGEICRLATGACEPVVIACLGQAAGTTYCEGNAVASCDSGLAPRDCGQGRVCRATPQGASCACLPPTVEQAGECRVADSCELDNGGCDPVTICELVDERPRCGACPQGYIGDGATGCAPTLQALVIEGAQLEPAFQPSVLRYSARVPLVQGRASLTVTVPEQSEVTINGSPVASGETWALAPASAGQQAVALVVTSAAGLTQRYELLVERQGAQEAYIKADWPGRDDGFGSAIDLWGDTLVVGAYGEDGSVGGLGGAASDNRRSDSGAVYIFQRGANGWDQQTRLKTNEPAVEDFFGIALALHQDTLAVSVLRHSLEFGSVGMPGAVEIFGRDAEGKWSFLQRWTSPAEFADYFGFSVALTDRFLVVGAPGDGFGDDHSWQGAVYVFERDGTTLSSPTKLVAPDAATNTVFGWSVAAAGSTLVVGAIERNPLSFDRGGPGAAYIFEHGTEGWLLQQRLRAATPVDGGSFGWAVALRGDQVLVGAPQFDLASVTPPGQVFLFERTGQVWAQTWQAQADVPRDSDYFGCALALGENTLAVGAYGDRSGSGGIGADPGRRDVEESGAVYLFDRIEHGYKRVAYIKATRPRTGDAFGGSLTLFGDTLAVSAAGDDGSGSGVSADSDGDEGLPGSGAVYVFR